MRDVLTNAMLIETIISDIEKETDKIEQAAMEKAETLRNYDKAFALYILKIKNGVIKEFEGESIVNLPASLINTVAKALCYNEIFDREIADANYKAVITRIEAKKAILNGYQSLNKTLQ